MAREILRLQRGMIKAVVRHEDHLGKEFWLRFYILTGQFMECTRSAKAQADLSDHPPKAATLNPAAPSPTPTSKKTSPIFWTTSTHTFLFWEPKVK